MESLFTDPYKIESNGLFAKDSTVPDIKDTGNASDADLSFQLGIPPRFSLPPESNGLFLRRGMMNAIGKMASAAPFYMGIGYIYTYDSDIAEKIGGYPKGAILRYTDANGRSHLVESLLENNEVDFRDYGPDGSSWAVITGGSRSFFINWGSLKVRSLVKFKDGVINATAYTPIASPIVVEKDSMVFSGNLNFTASASGTGVADLAVCIKIRTTIKTTVEGSEEPKVEETELWVPIATAAWWSSETKHVARIYSSGGILLKAGTSVCVCAIGTISGINLEPATEIPGAVQNYDNAFLCYELAEV